MPDRYDELVDREECEFCDSDGIRLGQLSRCDHVDYASIAKRGMEQVRRALGGRA